MTAASPAVGRIRPDINTPPVAVGPAGRRTIPIHIELAGTCQTGAWCLAGTAALPAVAAVCPQVHAGPCATGVSFLTGMVALPAVVLVCLQETAYALTVRLAGAARAVCFAKSATHAISAGSSCLPAVIEAIPAVVLVCLQVIA